MSFAFDGVGGRWLWFEEDGRKVAIAEIRQHAEHIAAEEGPIARRDFLQLVSNKLKRAERGELHVPDDGRASLVLVQGIMEIKWSLGAVQWRLYYCEPLRLHAGRAMLGLHFDRKSSLDEQDRQITEAARRWTVWQGRS